MRKTLVIISVVAATIISFNLNAQIPGVGMVTKKLPKPLFGIKVGGNFNKLSTSGSELSNAYQPSFLPGIFAGLRKGDWGLRLELTLNTAKYDYSFAGVQHGTFKNLYLDIPLLLERKVFWRIWAQAGPQFSQILSSGSDHPLPSSAKDFFQSNTYSGVLGLEARLPVHLILGARYILGFSDVNKSVPSVSETSNAWKARTAQIYVGFRFI